MIAETSPTTLAVNLTKIPAALTLTEIEKLGIHTPESLDSLCAKESRRPYIVEGFLPTDCLGIAVGDSGLGKSPLFYLLGLCIAAEKPWLGMKTQRGTVLYLDRENGSVGSKKFRDSVMQHLQLEKYPENFLCSQEITDMPKLTDAIKASRPSLVVIDTLRSFDASAEESNTLAGKFLNALRALSLRYHVTFLLIHHTKKQDRKRVLDFGGAQLNLEKDPAIQWLELACGAKALVNQSDVRLGIDRTSTGNADLVLKSHARITGEFGPIYLERVFDDDEEPIGYRKLSGIALLNNREQQDLFEALPAEFSFKEVKAKYGKGSQATTDFLKKGVRFEILSRTKKGYEKLVPRGEGG